MTYHSQHRDDAASKTERSAAALDGIVLLTVVSPSKSVLTKTLGRGADGTWRIVRDYGGISRVRAKEYLVDGLDSLAAELTKVASDPRVCAIRGGIRPDFIDEARQPHGVRRLAYDRPAEGVKAAFEARDRRWVACDLDSFELPDFVDPIRDIEFVIDAALEQLPPEFRDVSCFWQLTSGHGIKKGGRCRLWFWLSRPTSNQALKNWLGSAKVDTSVFAIVQPIYTAAPILPLGVPDVLPGRFGVRAGRADEVEVPRAEDLSGYRGASYGAMGNPHGFVAASVDEALDMMGDPAAYPDGRGFHAPIKAALAAAIRADGSKVDQAALLDRIDAELMARGHTRDAGYIKGRIRDTRSWLEWYVRKALDAEAVHAGIDAALLRDFKAPTRHSVEEARQLLKQPVRDFFAAAEAWHEKHAAAIKQSKETLLAAADIPAEIAARRRAMDDARVASLEARTRRSVRPATRETREAADAARGAAKQAREHAKHIARQVPDEAKKAYRAILDNIRAQSRADGRKAAGPPPVQGIKADLGLGKSTAVRPLILELLQRLRAAGDDGTIVIAVPTHALGDEQAERLSAIIGPHGFTARVWRSRHASVGDEPMCRDIDAVKDAEAATMNPQHAVCFQRLKDGTEIKCPLFDICKFQRQREAKPNVWFVAHELPFHQKPRELGKVALLIIDESPWADGLFGKGSPVHRDGTENTSGDAPLRLALDTLLSDATVPGDWMATGELQSQRRTEFDALSAAFDRVGDGPVPRADIAGRIDPRSAVAASKLEWERKIDVDMRPGMDAAERRALAEQAAPNKTISRLSAVHKALAALAADDGPEKSGWLSLRSVATAEGTVRTLLIKGRHEIAEAWQVPTLLLDATMAPELLRQFWPNFTLTAEIQVKAPHQRIIQVGDRSYSKQHVSNPRNVRRVHAILYREALRYARARVLAVVQKDIEEQLPDFGPLRGNLELAHHNSVAGRDEWGDVAALTVVGRTSPQPAAVENMAECLTGAAVDRLEGRYPRVSGAREMADGTAQAAEADQHPDPMCEAIRWQIVVGEIVQIIGRGRGVNRKETNPVYILAMVGCPIPMPVNSVISYRDLEPSPLGLMVAAGGLAPTSPTDAASAYPTLWDTPNAAQLAFQRWETEVGTKTPISRHSLYNTSYWRMTGDASDLSQPLHSVEYRVTGNGREPTVAYYDPDLVQDPAAWLSDRVGKLDWCGKKPELAVELSAVEKMAAAGLLLGGAHAVAFYPDLFPSGVGAAKKAVSRAFDRRDPGFHKCTKHAPCRISYQVAGAGSRPSLAFCSPERLPGLRAEMEATLGPLSVFRFVSQYGLPSFTVIDEDGFLVDGLDAILDEMPTPLLFSGKRALDYIRARHPGPLPEASVILTAVAIQGRERLAIYA
ncbi:hypothetical protein [Rhodopila sp.]|uniref:hypothetical protein n=1 Tax=Rhodopila sp. TaxID=2480087 RepID=UPI003D134DB1